MSGANFYHITPEGKMRETKTPSEAMNSAKNGGFVWFNYYKPEKEVLAPLAGLLGLHSLSIEDCFDENQIPKIEDFPKNTFILFNSFTYAAQKLFIEEIDLFIGENFVVSVSGRGHENGNMLSGVERSVEIDAESVKLGPAFLLHVIIDHIVDKKFAAIEALEEELDAAEDKMLLNVSGFEPALILRLRRDLLALRKSLFHEREILVRICRKDCPFIGEKTIFLYRDIYDHLAKFFELTETNRDIVTSLMEMYLSLLNNQMALAANETNISVRRLTLITTVFMPLTLIAGVGGMSEWSMMTGPENWKLSYPLFMLAMLVIGVVNYYILKWLERKDKKSVRP
jgi:magnesium transporter